MYIKKEKLSSFALLLLTTFFGVKNITIAMIIFISCVEKVVGNRGGVMQQ